VVEEDYEEEESNEDEEETVSNDDMEHGAGSFPSATWSLNCQDLSKQCLRDSWYWLMIRGLK
jgi:hypothetical protein